MKYLLDTDVVVDHLRGKVKLEKSIVSESVSISIVSYGELIYGAEKSKEKGRTKILVKEFLQDLSIKILLLDRSIMEEYAKIKAELEIKGKKLDEFDLLIGATAKVNSLVLVTRNRKHFERINGLRLS